ncbi:hypothetical protein C4K13_2989 [Pseudomonas chlororaphis subsp. aureofaciens]|nr:hypothetical protein C4K13_2989 [Pseudomonas chlororaphis subsp. aureofaciens]AZD98860.1 hypothetical protein C4K12_2994 [Pseudomonas chlororaphis subsp. aureofaciens]AZE35989.1 hypothetical protein C4K06_2956 [Pseudomonas chlororaphis subsp. aureofaciens]
MPPRSIAASLSLRSGYEEHGAYVAAAEQREAAIGNAVAAIRAARST